MIFQRIVKKVSYLTTIGSIEPTAKINTVISMSVTGAYGNAPSKPLTELAKKKAIKAHSSFNQLAYVRKQEYLDIPNRCRRLLCRRC